MKRIYFEPTLVIEAFLACVMGSSCVGVCRFVVSGDSVSQREVGRGESAVQSVTSRSRVGVPPGPAGSRQNAQALALQQTHTQ